MKKAVIDNKENTKAFFNLQPNNSLHFNLELKRP